MKQQEEEETGALLEECNKYACKAGLRLLKTRDRVVAGTITRKKIEEELFQTELRLVLAVKKLRDLAGHLGYTPEAEET